MMNNEHQSEEESGVSRRAYLTTAAAVGSAGLAGCLGMGGDSSGSALEVLHAWTGGDGERAINALTSKFEEQYPDTKTDFRPIGGGGNTNLNTVMSKRLGNNNPPSSFAGWPGSNLTQYEGILGDASDAWQGLEDKHIEEAVSLSKYNGTFRAMPIGSHRLNDLFYNKNVLEEAGVTPEDITSHGQLISALEKVGQNTDKVPMAQGMKLPWTTLQLFATTLLSTHGYQPYMDFTKGNGDKAKVTDALESTKQILNNHINDDASSIGLTGALDKIMNGGAAFIHQGNWAAGAFGGKENFAYGEDWGHITYPGTKGMYTLHIDSFIKPGNNPSPEKTTKWLSFAGTKEAQIAFNTRKGSIPTRTDIGTSEFGDYLTNTIDEFQNADEKPPTLAHGLAVSASTLTKLKGDINDNFTGPYNVDAAADAMLQTIGDGQA